MASAFRASKSTQDKHRMRVALEELEPRCLLAGSAAASAAMLQPPQAPTVVPSIIGPQQPGGAGAANTLPTGQASGTATAPSIAVVVAGAAAAAAATPSSPTAVSPTPANVPLSAPTLFPTATFPITPLFLPQIPPQPGLAASIPVAGGPGLSGPVTLPTPLSPVPPTQLISPVTLISPVDYALISPLRVLYPQQESGGGNNPVLLPPSEPPLPSLFPLTSLPSSPAGAENVAAGSGYGRPSLDNDAAKYDIAQPADTGHHSSSQVVDALPVAARDAYFAQPAFDVGGPMPVLPRDDGTDPAPDRFAAAMLTLAMGGYWTEKPDEELRARRS
jgi:hypothetical protein